MTITKATNNAQPIKYLPSTFGFKGLDGFTGKGVRIALIDSGVPNHNDLILPSDHVNFTRDKSYKDGLGQSSCTAGVLVSNNPKAIVGLCTDVQILYAKAIEDEGSAQFDAIISAILWAIIKQSNIISINIGSTTDSEELRECIKKANELGILVVSQRGENTEIVEYPARYEGVLSVKNGQKLQWNGNSLILPAYDVLTTFTKQKFTKASGCTISTSIAAGICACAMEKVKSFDRNLIFAEIKI